MVWMWGVPQKLKCETMQEGSEEKWLGFENLNLISELIPDGINWVLTGGGKGMAGGDGDQDVALGYVHLYLMSGVSLCFLITSM